MKCPGAILAFDLSLLVPVSLMGTGMRGADVSS